MEPMMAATNYDEDFMVAAAIAVTWSKEWPADEDAEAGAIRLRRDIHAICVSCMPRSEAPRRAGAVYWWYEDIARLREACIRVRRLYTRSRRKRRVDEATVARLYGVYREARRPLQRAIKEAKRLAWDELLVTLDSDPWGRSYRLVLNKLRPRAPLATERMDSLFPGTVNEETNGEGKEQEPLPPEEEGELSNIAVWRHVSRGQKETCCRCFASECQDRYDSGILRAKTISPSPSTFVRSRVQILRSLPQL
jgi:hypothetical protein